MESVLSFLTTRLNLGTPHLAAFVLTRFTSYAVNFLSHHSHDPYVLDPDLAHILARVRLTMAHRPTDWLWMQHHHAEPAAKHLWGQEEYATDFVLQVLGYMVSERLLPKDCDIETAARQIHERLCILQSVWVGNRVWVGDVVMQGRLREALGVVMGEVQREGF